MVRILLTLGIRETAFELFADLLKQVDIHLMIQKAVYFEDISFFNDSVFANSFFQKLHKLFYSLFKFLIIAHNKNEQDDQRQNIGNVNARPGGEFYALAGVGFCQEVFPAPAVSAGTEQQIDHAAQGQEVVGNNEVLEILNRGASAHRLETGPDVEAEYAGQGQEDNRNSIDQDGFFTGMCRTDPWKS